MRHWGRNRLSGRLWFPNVRRAKLGVLTLNRGYRDEKTSISHPIRTRAWLDGLWVGAVQFAADGELRWWQWGKYGRGDKQPEQ